LAFNLSLSIAQGLQILYANAMNQPLNETERDELERLRMKDTLNGSNSVLFEWLSNLAMEFENKEIGGPLESLRDELEQRFKTYADDIRSMR
jgi:hypothetical protein